jgi:hypothetical protein
MSGESANSLFVYNELLFADWLDKPCIVAMVKNSWNNMRLNIQALLGSCPAVDFETKPFHESLDVLLYHVKPFRNMPAVILEQEFLDRMVDGIKPLRVLVNSTGTLSVILVESTWKFAIQPVQTMNYIFHCVIYLPQFFMLTVI